VDEGIIEGGEDAGDAEDEFTWRRWSEYLLREWAGVC